MRKCKICGEIKSLEEFRKRLKWRAHTCKKCYAAQYRTGKPNEGRFKKNDPRLKQPGFNKKKREEPRYKKIGRPLNGKERQCYRYCKWQEDVFKKGKYVCLHCGKTEDLVAHHIIPWEENIEKRFDVNNGECLCRSCHSRQHRLLEIKNDVFHSRRNFIKRTS